MSDGEALPTIAGLVSASDDFNILLKAVTAADLVGALSADDADLTVFAPTDAAFVKLAQDFGYDGDPHDEHAVFDAIAGALAGLAPDGDAIPVLTNVLLYHVSPGAKSLTEVAALADVPTLLTGATFSPSGTELIDNEPDLADPSLAVTDVNAANGIVHVIDRVLIPLDIPGNTSNAIVIEAEDMALSGYGIEADLDASGDELIKLSEHKGIATTDFAGEAGTYDLELFYFDENDGEAKIAVQVNGETVKQIHLDEHLNGNVATADNARSVVVEGLHLAPGDKIELVGYRNDGEFARIDKISLTPVEPGPTIADVATDAGNFEILLKAVTAAGLTGPLIDPKSDLTVFAPTDEAFAKLAQDFGYAGDPADKDAVFAAIADALAGLAPDGDPIPVLTNVLLYHISPGAKPLAEVAALNDVPTLLEGATFSPDGTTLVDNEPDLADPTLVDTDIGASNGIIHAIDRVLIPLDIPGNEPTNIVVEAEDMHLSGYGIEHDSDASGDQLIKLSEHKGVATTEFAGEAGTYDLELFYFDENDGEAKIAVQVNGETVKQIHLDEHLNGNVATAENARSVVVEGLHLAPGDKIELVGYRNDGEFARIDKISLTPVEPGPTIADVATDAGNFEILLKAVTAAGLTGPLIDPKSDLTVFAPTDEAFAKLAQDFGYAGDPADKDAVFAAIADALAGLAPDGDPIPVLTNVLLYHISPGAKPLAEVAALNDVPTLLEGATLSPDGTTLVDNEPDLADPTLVDTDIGASNGIIHVIDRVLIPLDIPGNEPDSIIVEAEDMHLSGYGVEHDSDASGDQLIKLSDHRGVAESTFDGPDGTYDLELFCFDENDGEASIQVEVNGHLVGQIHLDQELDGHTATAGNATSVTIEGLTLSAGDSIELIGYQGGGEFARIDKWALTRTEDAATAAAFETSTEDNLL